MNWDWNSLNWENARALGGVGLIILGFLRYGDKLLDWLIATSKTLFERRVRREDKLEAELDAIKVKLTDLETRCNRVCDAYEELQERLPHDAEVMQSRLRKLGIDDPMLNYILEVWKRIRPLDDMFEDRPNNQTLIMSPSEVVNQRQGGTE